MALQNNKLNINLFELLLGHPKEYHSFFLLRIKAGGMRFDDANLLYHPLFKKYFIFSNLESCPIILLKERRPIIKY